MAEAAPDLKFPDNVNPKTALSLLTAGLERAATDPGYLAGMHRAVPGVGAMYGVRIPQLRAIARQVNAAFRKRDEAIEALADDCWSAGSREHRILAILMLAGHKAFNAERRWSLGLRFLPDVSDWELCDHLCMGLLGPALAQEPAYMSSVETWAGDANFWMRRAALACTVMLRRSKAATEVRRELDVRTLGICLRLLDDGEHYVRKAVDWSVREVLGRHYSLACDWLLERSQTNLTTVARSTLKQSARKLTPDDQTHFFKNLD